jgi:mRNA-degrading endonuclease YafQ of YafQ-DinJ toxin-antitoxin module
MKVAYHHNFIKQLKKLHLDLREEVLRKIEIFEENHMHISLKTHRLQGKMKNLYSFSVNYRYRIVFEINSDEALFLEIGTHDLYK